MKWDIVKVGSIVEKVNHIFLGEIPYQEYKVYLVKHKGMNRVMANLVPLNGKGCSGI